MPGGLDAVREVLQLGHKVPLWVAGDLGQVGLRESRHRVHDERRLVLPAPVQRRSSGARRLRDGREREGAVALGSEFTQRSVEDAGVDRRVAWTPDGGG